MPSLTFRQLSDSVKIFINPISTGLDRKASLWPNTTAALWGKLALGLELCLPAPQRGRRLFIQWWWWTDVCIYELFCKMVGVVFKYTGHLSVSTLHPVLPGFITKKMSGCEEKQEDMKRSAEGQCTKHGRKLEVKTNLLFYFAETWRFLDGEKWIVGQG